jgi:hypothetical protein
MNKKKVLGPKTILLCICCAIIITSGTMLYKNSYCACGPGWGYPFPVYHVVCGTFKPSLFTFDILALLLDVFLYSLAICPFLTLRAFLVHRKLRVQETASSEPVAQADRKG